MMRLVFTIAIASLILAGCATTQTPEPIIVTKTVEVPVKAKCVPDALGATPDYVDTNAALFAAPDAAERYQLLAAGRGQRIARLSELETVVAGCR